MWRPILRESPPARGGVTTARVQGNGGTMSLSRRGFVRRFGQATAGTVTGTMLAARGFEDLVAARAAGQDRPEIPPGMIRLGSNENPYGPGPHAQPRGPRSRAPRASSL